jgi:hypothetical protein
MRDATEARDGLRVEVKTIRKMRDAGLSGQKPALMVPKN